MPQIKPEIETFARIKVVGVGGSGCNAISRMMSCGIKGVDFVAINTDVQALHNNKAQHKIHIGKVLTRGMGAGMNPEIGRRAAEENKEEIQQALRGSDMVFITCGLGGGTGSGASSVIAELAKETGALTVAVVTKPFSFEGTQRMRIAEEALTELKQKVDTIIVIPNDRLLNIIDKKISLLNAFGIVDDVLRQAVQGISDLIIYPGIVNLDFADIKTIMENSGPAIMGIGRATGEDRAIEAAKVITESADRDARVIFGAVIDDKIKKGEIKITVIATGFNHNGSSHSNQMSLDPEMNTPITVEVEKRRIISKEITKEENGKTSYKSPLADDGDDEWDVPTFLRKKK